MTKTNVVREEWYTAIGKQDFIDKFGYPVTSKDGIAYAKTLFFEDGRIHHYIRQNQQGEPLDPATEGEYKTRSERMIRETRYKQVKPDTFKRYKQFLRKPSKALYQEVMRKFI